MKPNELRIGNYVNVINPRHSEKYLEIESISFESVNLCFREYNLTDLQPIPLTEEWFLKLPKHLVFPEWIKHVHTLQNWYYYENKCEKELIFN